MTARQLLVYIVDDEPGMCLGAKRAIEGFTSRFDDIDVEARFTTETFDTGEAVLAQLEQKRPDILFLDCRLPGIGGMEILETIAPRGKSIIPIMITAYGTLETAVRATKLGAYDFLAKPFTAEGLINRISYVINKPRDFIDHLEYFGPDRRRKKIEDYKGPCRRKSDKVTVGWGNETKG